MAPPAWLRDVERLDLAVYAAVAGTPTPDLDAPMRRLAAAADYSRLSLAAAALLGLAGGRKGRRAARAGLTSIAATSAIVNLGLKPLARRRRPLRAEAGAPLERHVQMPSSRSLPSGHAASAFAFATGVGRVAPVPAVPLRLLAALVAYSRVHTGVHFPGDVLAGALVGTAVAELQHGLTQSRRP